MEDEVGKLLKDSFIQEIKYLTWQTNIITIKKKSGKWRMGVNFTYLSKAYPKEPYSLPHIDRLINGASNFRLLSLMDVYSSYN